MVPKPHTKTAGSSNQSLGGEQTPEYPSSSQGSSSQADGIESHGLYTDRNWCYVSSVFQAFLHAPEFVQWLQQEHQSCFEDCIPCAFRAVSLNYWTENFNQDTLEDYHDNLKRTLGQSFEFYQVRWDWVRQQDAAEFYIHMINALKERNPNMTGPAIDRLFQFDFTHIRLCPNCKNRNRVPGSQNLLQVAFEGGAPLEEILRRITFGWGFYPTVDCSVCHGNMDQPTILRLVTGPKILVMQLVRFTDWNASESKKNNAVIPFNEDIDLSPYTDGNFALRYRLLSVVQHHGTVKKGHFINLAKERNGGWTKLNDDRATRATRTDPFCPRAKNAFTPYLLFWGRVDEDVVTEPPTSDETAVEDEDAGDDDDKKQPVQISINGVLQPPSEKHFIKNSLLPQLKQPHIEEVSANINTALSEVEAFDGEMSEKGKEQEEGDRGEGKEDDKEDDQEKMKEKEEKTTKKGPKNGNEKQKEKAKTPPKETKTSSQNDVEKVENTAPKVQKQKGKGEKRKKEEEEEEEQQESEQEPKKEAEEKPLRRSPRNHEGSKAPPLKKQKTSTGAASSQDKKKKADSKNKKTSDKKASTGIAKKKMKKAPAKKKASRK